MSACRSGHKVTPTAPLTAVNSIAITPNGYVGAADRRTRSSLAAGYCLMTETGDSVERVRAALRPTIPTRSRFFRTERGRRKTRRQQSAAPSHRLRNRSCCAPAAGCSGHGARASIASMLRKFHARLASKPKLPMVAGCATTGFAIGGVAPVGHIESPRVFIDADLMTLDPIWPPPALRVMCFAAHHRAGPADRWYHCRRERMIGAGEVPNPRPRPWQGRALPLSYTRVFNRFAAGTQLAAASQLKPDPLAAQRHFKVSRRRKGTNLNLCNGAAVSAPPCQ